MEKFLSFYGRIHLSTLKCCNLDLNLYVYNFIGPKHVAGVP